MFKNQSATNPQDTTNIQKQNLSQEKDFKIEDIPISTMAQDIYDIEHPGEKVAVISEDPAKIATDNQMLTEKQKTSPFLNPAISESEKKQPRMDVPPMPNRKSTQPPVKINSFINPAPAAEKSPSPANNFSQSVPPTLSPSQKISSTNATNNYPITQKDATNKNGIFAIIIAVLILLITGSGTYYFLTTRQNNIESIAVLPEIESNSDPVTEQAPVITEPKTELSADKPNYMLIDLESSDSVALKDKIKDYVQKTLDSTITTPIEFAVVDTRNNPIEFENFAKKLELTLSPALLSELSNEFSLFIYNDQSDMRLGLSVNIQDALKLKTALIKEEKMLAKNLQALFIPVDYKFNSLVFKTSNYNGIEIKYLNASDDKNLSIDYAILNKQLIIGTSKMTARMILDNIATRSIQEPK